MKLDRFYATRAAREHMAAKHHVEWHEVREVLSGTVRAVRTRDVCGEKRYVINGHADSGRRLRIVVAGESLDTFRVITAFEVQ